MATRKPRSSSREEEESSIATRIPGDLSFIQRILVDKFGEMPLWVRVSTYLVLLLFTLYMALVPRFIYGTCMVKGSGEREDPYRGAVGVYVESQLIMVNMNDDGAWAVPLVSKLPKSVDLNFVVFEEGKKTLYPLRLSFLSIVLSDRHKVYVTPGPQPHFMLASYPSAGGIFSRAAYAQNNLPATRQIPQASTRDHVSAIVSKIFRVQASTLTPKTDLRKDLGANSINLSQLVSELQRTFRITIDSAAWDQLYTLEDIYRYIERKQVFLAGLDSQITAALQGYSTHEGLHLAPNIPGGKLRNARDAADVPKEESVFGLIDATLFRSAKLAILFGRQGVYYRTSWTRQEGPSRAFIDYEDLAQRTIEKADVYQISLGNGQYFTLAGSAFEAEELVEILSSVQGAIRNRLRALTPASSGHLGSRPSAP